MKERGYFLLFMGALLLGLLFVSGGISSSNYNIDSLVISSGGDNVSSSGFSLKTIVGMISGALSSVSFLNDIGFYYATTGDAISGCTSCSACNSEIVAASSGETVTLGADITNQDGNCIEFAGKDDVTFDCDGHIIGGDGDDTGWGIYLSTDSNNNTIKDCTNISEFYYGVIIYQSEYNTLINNTATNNSDDGIYLQYSSSNILINNTATADSADGIYVEYSSNNTLINNTATSDSGRGIRIRQSSSNSNTLIDNTATSNSGQGINIFSSTYNNLTNNIATSNSSYGIYFESSSSHNILTNNTVISNSYYGIYLGSSSSNNTLISNNVTSDSSTGIYLLGSLNNTLTNNTAISNTSYGIYVRNSANYNTLTNNTAISDLNHGIYLESVSNNILVSNTGNCTGVQSAKSAIRLNGANYNNLTDNIGDAASNQGICLIGSSNNTLVNNIGMAGTIYYGIWIHSSSGNNITNNTGTSNSGEGIYLASSASDNILTNNTGTSDSGYGIYLLSSPSNVLIDNIARSESYRGLGLSVSDYNSISGLNASVTSGGYGVYLNDAAYNNFTDSVYLSGGTDVYVDFTASSVDNIFLNCSYDSESVNGAGNNLIRQWWFGVYVNDSTGAAVNGANVSGFNSSEDLQFSVLTNSSGWIDKLGITEYVNIGGSVSYYSDYKINASEGTKSGELTGYNVSEVFNKLDNVITIDDLSAYFNSQWDTTNPGTSNSTTIALPLEADGDYDFVVDWGDGNSTIVTTYDSVNATHDYLVEGTYNVSISGTIEGFRFNGGGG